MFARNGSRRRAPSTSEASQERLGRRTPPHHEGGSKIVPTVQPSTTIHLRKAKRATRARPYQTKASSPRPSPTRARVCGTRVAARGEREPAEFAAPLCLIVTKDTPFERNVR
jgi:hypothetical protein